MYDTNTDVYSLIIRAIGSESIVECPVYTLTMFVESTFMMLSTHSGQCRDSSLFCLVQESSLHSHPSDRVGKVVGLFASHVV
jgi:hypothetical protein